LKFNYFGCFLAEKSQKDQVWLLLPKGKVFNQEVKVNIISPQGSLRFLASQQLVDVDPLELWRKLLTRVEGGASEKMALSNELGTLAQPQLISKYDSNTE